MQSLVEEGGSGNSNPGATKVGPSLSLLSPGDGDKTALRGVQDPLTSSPSSSGRSAKAVRSSDSLCISRASRRCLHPRSSSLTLSRARLVSRCGCCMCFCGIRR